MDGCRAHIYIEGKETSKAVPGDKIVGGWCPDGDLQGLCEPSWRKASQLQLHLKVFKQLELFCECVAGRGRQQFRHLLISGVAEQGT